jgi:predicted Zn-dependent peptidase
MRHSFALAALALLAPLATAHADERVDVELTTATYTLTNGLQLVVVPDAASPTVAVAVYYDVGSRNEEVGRSGFAHLFEHMMFQGSANVAKAGHFTHIARNGGSMNGTTSTDRTNYFEILPSDRLELALWLESDRMMSLAITDENFENQRQVVKEERRQRIDNQPYGPARLEFDALVYDAWEYEHSVIGSMDDLDAAELSDVQEFFDLHYAPNNAVLVIAGDVDPDHAFELVTAWFGDIPAGEEPPAVSIVEEPRTEMRTAELVDALAAQPAGMVAWLVPPAPAPESDALELLATILGGGESSRLYDRLVRRDQVALSVSAWVSGRRGPDTLSVQYLTRGGDARPVLDALREEVARIREQGVTDEELTTARRMLLRDAVASVEGNLGRALTVGRDTLYYSDPDRINDLAERLEGVTADKVQEAAATWLTDENLAALFVDTDELAAERTLNDQPAMEEAP